LKVQCEGEGCGLSFHPTCAVKAGFASLQRSAKGRIKFALYCPDHAPVS
jgi:hypothetical protein